VTASSDRAPDNLWDRDSLPHGDDKAIMVQAMFDQIAPRYDLVNRIMTFRLDTRWRKRAVQDLRLKSPSLVLDLASGTGDLCIDLTKRGHTAISIDLSFGMLSNDTSSAPRVQADILRLPMPDGSVDGIICGFALRNLVDLPQFFAELFRVVRPGGRISLLDVGIPHNWFIRTGALLSDGAAYRYLPRSVSYLPAPDVLLQMIVDAGFADAQHHELSGGLTQLMHGTRNI